jgi:glycosyltransferase involved in cell wall biosynthesis
MSRLKTLLHYKSGDITHLSTHQLAFVGKLRMAKNCVVTVHDLIQHHYYSLKRSVQEVWLPNEFILGSFSTYIADSDYTKRDLVYNFGVPEERITVVRLGVDHTVFTPKNREECRRKFNMSEDKIYLIAVSSGERWKNTSILKNLPYEVLDVGYGRGQFGELEEERLVDLYCACDAFLAPSKAEGFGLPVVEAMACGTPVIASNCTAFPEVVGTGGKLVNPDDINAWTHAIEDVVGSRGKWSKKALNQSNNFSWEKMGNETLRVYEDVYLGK